MKRGQEKRKRKCVQRKKKRKKKERKKERMKERKKERLVAKNLFYTERC
jgi:hypothetical protein